MGDMTDDFSWHEFRCKCGCKQDGMDMQFISRLQRARCMYDNTMTPTSGYRCRKHPESQKNSTSSHIKGVAVDLACTDSRARFKIIESLLQVGFTRIGVSKEFIHVDSDRTKPQEVYWTY